MKVFKTGLKAVRALLIVYLMLGSSYSCKSPQRAATNTQYTKEKFLSVKAPEAFYKEYSIKLNAKLTGTEDPKLIKTAAKWLGVPYKFGGMSKSGVDCSGMVKSIYKEAYGIELNRNSADMVNNTVKVQKNQLKAGDLVFFTFNAKRISHVGIYIANNKFIHASSSRGVAISDLNASYYKRHFVCAGRVKIDTRTTG